MLSIEDGNLLTNSDIGTPMGSLMRQYWVPALLSSTLKAGESPVRITLLGEKLIAFRSSENEVGIVSEFCAHRRASLFYGRNEGTSSSDGKCGLRCAYHGWKYDVAGRCIDMPNEPPTSRFKERISLVSYPAQERAGIVWAYLGGGEQPRLPEFEWAMVPPSHRFVSRRVQRSNFMQAMEGGLDSSHVSFLHSDAPLWNPPWTHQSAGIRKHLKAGNPKFFVEPTDYGLLIGARRVTDENKHYWRVTQWIMPWYSIVPRDEGEPIGAHAWVPIDDHNCWVWSINYLPERPLSQEQIDFYRSGGGIHAETISDTGVPVRNRDNEYLIDRALQKSGVSLSGIAGIAMQDAAMQESMGAIVDRREEHLGSTDIGIVTARRRLISEAKGFMNGLPVSGRDPSLHRVRSASAVLPPEASWVEATSQARAALVDLYRDVPVLSKAVE